MKKFRGGVQWYMIESRDFTSYITFIIEKQNGKKKLLWVNQRLSDYQLNKFNFFLA